MADGKELFMGVRDEAVQKIIQRCCELFEKKTGRTQRKYPVC